MKRIFSFSLSFIMALTVMTFDISFIGSSKKIIEVTPDKKTGIDKIFVVWNIAEVESMIVDGADNTLSIERYSNLGGGFSEPISFHWDGVDKAVVDHPAGNIGYIISYQGRTTYIWVVDYSSFPFTISRIDALPEQDCDNTKLQVDGSGPTITYYTIDGRAAELERDITLAYATLSWNEQSLEYERVNEVHTLPHLTNPITLLTPFYCSTEVEISGDRFLKEWNITRKAVSPNIQPNGIMAHTIATQTNLPDDTLTESNMIGGKGEGIGGSAPCIVRFTAYVTDAVIHDEWQISSDPDFENIEYRFTNREIEHSFEDEGTFYVRFIGSDAAGNCEIYGETYTISIGASELKIPNVFSPNDDGVNDIWKVAYRSLLDFKCWIFDRYGNEIYHFTDPNSGWDGTFRGKKVKSGVYFYVIEAKGSDGKKYKKGGDINIIDYKTPRTNTGSSVQ